MEDFPDIERVGLRYIYEAEAGGTSSDYRSNNVGFGITYTLPILLALLASEEDTLVLLENPEAHLHPKGQFKLGELMVRAASCGIQVIVESHSDHVLNGIRVAVRNMNETNKDETDKVKLFYLSRSTETPKVDTPTIDKHGRIDDWPEGFFDEYEKSLLELI